MAQTNGVRVCRGDPRYHLGHVVLEIMKQRPPGDIFQIDAATGEQETVGSVLSRSVRLARALRRLGLRPGDVLALAGRDHLHLRIPFYAAMVNGLPIVGVDPLFKYSEIKHLFKTTMPKIAFCDIDTYEVYAKIVKELNLNCKIVTFLGGDCSLSTLIDGVQDSADFEPAIFDMGKTYAWIVSTSGSTGVPKLAAIKHTVLLQMMGGVTHSAFMGNSEASAEYGAKCSPKYGLNSSPVQWLSAFFNAMLIPMSNYAILQTSKQGDIGHFIDIINTYKPKTLTASPSMFSSLLYHEKDCDFTCFDNVTIGGEKVYTETVVELKKRLREGATLQQLYGQTETLGPVIMTRPGYPLGSCGTPLPGAQLKLVDPSTGEEITEPNKTGELWVKGELMFSEYYNNPEETALAFSPDGWYKTGDLLYRDGRDNYYFVDRLKMLIKYRNIQVIPLEIEEVIYSHPGVLEAGVTGLPHPIDGELPAACVVRKRGNTVTARDIKHLVAEKLSSNKQLRGGVVFLDRLPKTSTGKVARHKLREIALDAIQRLAHL